MSNSPSLLLAVDPGRLTGYVLAGFGASIGVVEQNETPMLDFLDWAAPILGGETCLKRPDVVVCESYDITPATLKKSRGDNWSLEQIGVLRWLCHAHGVTFVLQRPSAVLPLIPDDRLEAFGLNKRGGKGHWRDAARHLVYYLAKTGKVDLPV